MSVPISPRFFTQPNSGRNTNRARTPRGPRRPSTARTYATHIKQNSNRSRKRNRKSSLTMTNSMQISLGNGTTHLSVFNPIDLEEKPRWLISTKSGTIYEDRKVRLQTQKETKDRLKPRIIRKMKECYNEIELDEIRKHEQRLRILYRFRLRRLENSLKCRAQSTLQNKPIIFTPELDRHLNPFNPDCHEIENHTSTTSTRLEKLAEPKLRCSAQTPQFADFQEPEIKKIVRNIKDLRNIRHQYHWRSFAHRADEAEFDDNASQCTADTVDTVSTCSNASNIQYINNGHIHSTLYTDSTHRDLTQLVHLSTADTVPLSPISPAKRRQTKRRVAKERRDTMSDLNAFELNLNYLSQKNKKKNKKQR